MAVPAVPLPPALYIFAFKESLGTRLQKPRKEDSARDPGSGTWRHYVIMLVGRPDETVPDCKKKVQAVNTLPSVSYMVFILALTPPQLNRCYVTARSISPTSRACSSRWSRARALINVNTVDGARALKALGDKLFSDLLKLLTGLFCGNCAKTGESHSRKSTW